MVAVGQDARMGCADACGRPPTPRKLGTHEVVRVWDKRRIHRQDVFPTPGESELSSTQISIKKKEG